MQRKKECTRLWEVLTRLSWRERQIRSLNLYFPSVTSVRLSPPLCPKNFLV